MTKDGVVGIAYLALYSMSEENSPFITTLVNSTLWFELYFKSKRFIGYTVLDRFLFKQDQVSKAPLIVHLHPMSSRAFIGLGYCRTVIFFLTISNTKQIWKFIENTMQPIWEYIFGDFIKNIIWMVILIKAFLFFD